MIERRNRYASFRASELALRDRLIYLPRRTKQFVMLFTDAIGFLGCAALTVWLDLINPGTYANLTLVAIGSLTATHILEPCDSGISSLLRVEMSGLVAKLFGPIMKKQMARALMEENLGLKKYCESSSNG